MNKTIFKDFDTWWDKIAIPKTDKIVTKYLKQNPEYTEEDTEDYTDSGCVHRMMHEGEAENLLWEICQDVFEKGRNNEDWEMSMGETLFCDLDNITFLAYKSGKSSEVSHRRK